MGLKDFEFGQVTSKDANVVLTQEVCVYSMASGSYSVTATGTTNKQGEFVITNNGQEIPLTLSWGGIVLQPNVSHSVAGVVRTQLTTCDKANAITLKLSLHPNTTTVLSAGNYQLNLQFHLAQTGK